MLFLCGPYNLPSLEGALFLEKMIFFETVEGFGVGGGEGGKGGGGNDRTPK